MGYVMRGRVATIAEKKMSETMPNYNHSHEITFVWDHLQRDVMRNYKSHLCASKETIV